MLLFGLNWIVLLSISDPDCIEMIQDGASEVGVTPREPDLEIGSLFSKVRVFCTQLFSPPRQIVSGRVRRAFNSHQVLRLRNENNSVHVRLHSSTIDFIGDLVYPIIRETEYSKTHESMEIARS